MYCWTAAQKNSRREIKDIVYKQSDLFCPANESFFLQTPSCRFLQNNIAHVFHNCLSTWFCEPFSLKQNYRKFQNKRIFCKAGGEGEEEKRKKKLKFHYKLSISCALNLKQSISYTDSQFWCPSCSLSQLLRRVQSQHLILPVTGFGGSCLWLAQPLTVCLLIFFLECM